MVFVSDLGEKEALIAANPDAFYSTSHYDGYAAVLVNLAAVDLDELRELITESWRLKAPVKLRRAFERGGSGCSQSEAGLAGPDEAEDAEAGDAQRHDHQEHGAKRLVSQRR